MEIENLEITCQIRYTYDEGDLLILETHSKPVEEEAEESPSEFDGVTNFVDVPNDRVQEYLDQDFYIYKVYQKNTILMKRGEV